MRITIEFLEDLINEIRSSNGGEGWFDLDGNTYCVDVGEMLDGLDIFMTILKRRIQPLN